MKRLTTLALAALLTAAGTASAQHLWEVKESRESIVDFFLTNHGIFGLDIENQRSGFSSPRGSNTNYLFGSGLWFGAMKQGLDSTGAPTLRPGVFITYNPNSGVSWATPGEDLPEVAPATHLPRLYHSVEHDPITGENIVPNVPPYAARKWPLWLKPGDSAEPQFPGHFEPLEDYRTVANGTYASTAFMPGVDEQFVSRYTDQDLSFYEFGSTEAKKRGYPLGLLIEQNVMAWKRGRFSETVVLQYQIINKSSDTLVNCVAAQASDPDLGNAANDHAEFYAARPELRATRVWTDREVQGSWGQLVSILLEAPVVDSNGFVDNSRRDEFRTNGRLGSFPTWRIENDPRTEGERYAFMTSGELGQDNGAADQRTMLASSTFSLRPGDTVHFTMAYAVLHGRFGRTRRLDGPDGSMLKPSNLDDDMALEAFSTALIDDYYSGIYHSLTLAAVDPAAGVAGDLSLSLQPNPARTITSLRYNLASPAQVRVMMVDGLGRNVATIDAGIGNSGENVLGVDISNLTSGTYTVVVEAAGKRAVTRMTVTK